MIKLFCLREETRQGQEDVILQSSFSYCCMMSAGHRNALCEQHDHNTNHEPFDMNNYQLVTKKTSPKAKPLLLIK